MKFPRPGSGALAILRRGNPFGLAWDLVSLGFPDLGGDDVIAPYQGDNNAVVYGVEVPAHWSIGCEQVTACFSGCAGQRTPVSHYAVAAGVHTCLSQCSSGSTSWLIDDPVSGLTGGPTSVGTIILGRQRGHGCPGTNGPTLFHSKVTLYSNAPKPTPMPEYTGAPDRPATGFAAIPVGDPLADPQAWPDTLPNHEVPLQPGIAEPSKAPNTAPMPNPDWPVPVATPGPGLQAVNGPTTIVNVRPGRDLDTDGSGWVLDPSGNPAPPGENTKEIKVRLLVAGRWVWVKLNSATEALDLVDSLFDALPYKTQFKAFYPKGDGYTTDPYHKAQAVYDNFEEVDVEKALENLLNNQIEDWMFGKVFNEKVVNQATGQATGGAGVFAGSEDVQFKAPTVDIDLERGTFDLTWDLNAELRR